MRDAPPLDGRWTHFVETVYGAWLYVDRRGFRTRHHRQHIAGDYKSPPPAGKYDHLLRRSRQSLKQQPVVVSAQWRPIVGGAVRDRLGDLGCYALCLAQCDQHLHLLAKLPRDASPRHWMGLAKKHATFEAKARGWTGRLWGRRGKEIHIRDRAHQLNVYHYILDHAHEGAWIWNRLSNSGPKPTDGRPGA